MKNLDYNDLLDNSYTYPNNKIFASIIGEHPSQGARSPKLWNAAFLSHKIDCKMLPMDVSLPNLKNILEVLEKDTNFIGGSITTPYKELVARWLTPERMTSEASSIGAVNCLFRNDNGRLFGTNTDGEAALFSFKSNYGDVSGKNILLLGPGGAGKAVTAFFANATPPKGKLFLAGRLNRVVGKNLTKRLNAFEWVQWDKIDELLSKIDILINCTSLGFGKTINISPIQSNQIIKLNSHCIVFDIIYQPELTELLRASQKMGLQILNGSEMNLEQAVIAYGYTAPEPNGKNSTRDAMKEIVLNS